MTDVPRDSLLKELGFSKETSERDPLDESLARTSPFATRRTLPNKLVTEHSRFVYKLQESDTSSSSDEDNDDSDDSRQRRTPRSSRSRRRRHPNGRMSLLTNDYFEPPPSKAGGGRRFFQSRLGWSEMYEKIVVKGEDADFFARGRLAALMEQGGRDEIRRWPSEEQAAYRGNAEDEWIEMDED